MSNIETGATGAARAEFAGVTLHLLRRYAASVPTAQRNDVDNAVWKALDRVPDAKRVAERLVQATDKLADEKKRARFGGTYAFKPASTTVPRRELEAIAGRLGTTSATTAPAAPSAAPPHTYELQFSHMICDDESNPEPLGRDEPYTVFSMITQRQADEGEPARSLRTPVYKANDGDRNPATGSQKLRLFGPSGAAAISSDVLLTATHFEHDLGDLAEIVADIGEILTTVAALAESIGLPVVAVVAGALSSIAAFVASIGADDPVGEPQALVLTQALADSKTQNSALVTLPAMKFDGGNENGIYRVFLTLRRAS
ncbi:hypothetical protein [Actinomadura rudentiformis]|uniref:Uncharacterized protein n=1 Tax=Actinomadura rudentiformis TaxID=359158 RepID=A0A6H9YKL0_9ACTN|nr:hypothetical protein [Actinomadura rudentiformis]KAB2347758.1 hypothetical protein F8566_17790 [Actinomadura rudentiformis]